MFNFQGSELIIILLLALVVLGPEKLPDAMRQIGRLYGELRKMSSSFQQEFRSVVDEPVREMRETADLLRDSADFTKLANAERPEKPKSAEMSQVGSPEMVGDAPDDEPVDEVPFRQGAVPDPADETTADDRAADDTAADASDEPPTRARGADAPTPVVSPPPPFSASGVVADDRERDADPDPEA